MYILANQAKNLGKTVSSNCGALGQVYLFPGYNFVFFFRPFLVAQSEQQCGGRFPEANARCLGIHTLCLGMVLMTRMMITSIRIENTETRSLKNAQNFENDDDEEKGLLCSITGNHDYEL